MKVFKKVIVLIPVFNESENIEYLVQEILDTRNNYLPNMKVVFINDGSKDDSRFLLDKVCENYDWVESVNLRKNNGKADALNSGIKFVLPDSPDYLVFIDGDGQDDPKEIPQMILHFEKDMQIDLITGRRKKRQDKFTKKISSKIFNIVLKFFTKTPGYDFNSGFKVMNYDVAKFLSITLYGELHRFIPILLYWNGFNILEIDVNHRPRYKGKSKYNLTRIWRAGYDLLTVQFLTKYKNKPGHLFAKFSFYGFFVTVFSLFLVIRYTDYGIYYLIPLFFTLISTQLLITGLIAELVIYSSKYKKVEKTR
jgi:dolichol-phosphate mannosyltransferase